jgi:hypothetical protein
LLYLINLLFPLFTSANFLQKRPNQCPKFEPNTWRFFLWSRSTFWMFQTVLNDDDTVAGKTSTNQGHLRGGCQSISWFLSGRSHIAPGWSFYNWNVALNICLHLLSPHTHRKAEKNENRNISALPQLFITPMVDYISDWIPHFGLW